MKNRLIWSIGLCFFILSFTQTAFAATVLHQLGVSPFAVPPLKTVADLKKVVAENPAEIRKGFEKAGYAGLFPAFSEQFPTADIKKIKVNEGEKMLWMLFRKFGKGPVRVAKDVTWAGKEPFDAFQFYVDQGGKRYDIVVPLICVNFAVRSITPIPIPKAVAPPPAPKVNQAPVCIATVSSDNAKCGETITIDGSGSTDADGQIAAMTVAVMDAQGNTVAEHKIDQAPFIYELEVPCDGTYTVKTTVTDDKGKSATGPNCESTVGVAAKKSRLRPVATLGFLRMWDPANFAPIRGGLEYRLTDNLSLLGMVGFNYHIDGSHGDNAMSADLLLHYWISRFFVGAGVGYWEMDDDSNDKDEVDGGHADLIAQTGVMVYGDPDAFNVSLFIEGRKWTDVSDLDLAGRLGAGILFRF